MKRWINKKIRLAWLYWHLIIPMWNSNTGRWYVWKDSPDRVVRFYAMLLPIAKEREHTDLIALFEQAAQERELRREYKHK